MQLCTEHPQGTAVSPREGGQTFHNWARGVAWYMLGLARCALLVRQKFVEEESRRMARAVVGMQQRNGLWSVFLMEPATGVNTSGSAGIAAALAIGARKHLWGWEAQGAARKALRALEEYLTPDGFLAGCAQINRGGEELQRSGYRVISQYSLGLMAQLSTTGVPQALPGWQ